MNANEIRAEVILGSHKNVRAFLSPVIEQIKTLGRSEVAYNGSGGIFVDGEDRAKVLAHARAVQAAFPELKVSNLWKFRGYTFGPVTHRFSVTVRS